jgi:hypothetical protein
VSSRHAGRVKYTQVTNTKTSALASAGTVNEGRNRGLRGRELGQAGSIEIGGVQSAFSQRADSAAARRWARQRFSWLDQVLADREITAAAFVLGYAISTFVNKDTGTAFPAQATLEKLTGLTERHIRTLTQLLTERGHLEMLKPTTRGRGHVNVYRPRLKDRKPDPGPTLFADAEMAPPEMPRQATTSPTTNSGFEDWCRQYPRRVAKGAAQRAYERALASGRVTHNELVAGALRYGAERARQDERFTKHPTTWLNQECWSDEPAAPGRAVNGQSWMGVATGEDDKP